MSTVNMKVWMMAKVACMIHESSVASLGMASGFAVQPFDILREYASQLYAFESPPLFASVGVLDEPHE